MDMEKKVMTCRQAGRKGGRTTSKRYGPDFYSQIGRKGGRRLSELIRKGRESEQEHEAESS
jgi:general stress protein YciG